MSNLPVFDQFLNRTKLASIPPSHCRYDVDKSSFIDLMELKLMMEKLGEPQTHLGLKAMIKAVDDDNDGQISFREVCTVWHGATFVGGRGGALPVFNVASNVASI